MADTAKPSPRCLPLAEAGYGETPELYFCADCGVVVASVPIHDKWHDDTKPTRTTRGKR